MVFQFVSLDDPDNGVMTQDKKKNRGGNKMEAGRSLTRLQVASLMELV